MTASEDRINELVQTVPTIKRTPWQKFWRAISTLCSLIAVVALVLALLSSLATSNLANCTNANLGTRSAPSANDARAHIAFAQAVLSLFDPEPRVSPTQRGLNFQAATQKYVSTLVADQKLRDAHPLGKC